MDNPKYDSPVWDEAPLGEQYAVCREAQSVPQKKKRKHRRGSRYSHDSLYFGMCVVVLGVILLTMTIGGAEGTFGWWMVMGTDIVFIILSLVRHQGHK